MRQAAAIYKCRPKRQNGVSVEQLWYVILSLASNQAVDLWNGAPAICVKYYECWAHKLGEKRMCRTDF